MPSIDLLVRNGSLLINVPSVHRFHEFCWWFHFSYENTVAKTCQLWCTSWECVWYCTVENVRSSWTVWPWRRYVSDDPTSHTSALTHTVLTNSFHIMREKHFWVFSVASEKMSNYFTVTVMCLKYSMCSIYILPFLCSLQLWQCSC